MRVALLIVIASCAPSEEDVRAEFDAFVAQSNRCQADSECVWTSADCPLGCMRAVRADRVAQVQSKARELIEDYERYGRGCEYECLGPSGPPVCAQGRCQEPRESSGGGPGLDGGACTAIGCGAPFTVHFDKPAPWPAGHYSVRVTLDGRGTECQADVPLSCEAPTPCADPAVQLQLSGCALPASAHAITGLDVISGAPGSVKVEVADAQGTLASGEWQPSYMESAPNGPGCGPACKSAPSETLAF